MTKTLVALAMGPLLAACATVGGDPVAHWRGLKTLGALEVGLLALDRGGERIDPRLALAFGDVCGERDATGRREALAAAGPRLEQARRAAVTQRAWALPLRQALGPWDPSSGFSTGTRNGSVIRFDRSDFCGQDLSFLVAFTNGDEFSMLSLDEAEARKLIRGNTGKLVLHDLEVEVVGAQPGPPAPTLLVRILRRRTRDALTERVLLDTGLLGHLATP